MAAVDATEWATDVLASHGHGFVRGQDAHYLDPQPSEQDPFAPQVSNFDPAPGTPIVPTKAVGFDVTDNVALRLTAILVRFAGTSLYEVAWDGSEFSPRYAGSLRTAIGSGHRYELRRSGGWPVAPTIHVMAIDTAGNEAA